MQPEHPLANAELVPLNRPFVSEIPKFRKIVAARGLVSLANNTKWNELLQSMRVVKQNEWTPSFRFQCIDSDYISQWDGEWWHHLPFPFISVLWFEISYLETIFVAQLLPDKVIDHSLNLEVLLKTIGFDFEKSTKAIRIFGYAPRNYTNFH